MIDRVGHDLNLRRLISQRVSWTFFEEAYSSYKAVVGESFHSICRSAKKQEIQVVKGDAGMKSIEEGLGPEVSGNCNYSVPWWKINCPN
jgi:hypothetical protein